LYWHWIRQPLSSSPCDLILAAIPVDLALERRGRQPHPVADPPLRAVGFAIVLTATSNHQRVSEAKAAGAVACLCKHADLSDLIDYVRQVVPAPQLGASISL
jgi:DNA-binding NarL/FixJ family response regulator